MTDVAAEINNSSDVENKPTLPARVDQTVLRLVEAGVFSPDPYSDSEMGVLLDMKKAQQILVPQINKVDIPISDEEDKKLRDETQMVYRRWVKHLSDSHIVPQALIVKTGEVLRPSDTRIVHDQRDSRFFYIGYDFPEENDRGELHVGYEKFQRRVDRVSQTLKNLGIDLSPEQYRTVALTALVAHEYGHALDKTMQMLKVKERLEQARENGEQIEDWRINIQVRDLLFDNLYSNIAPSQQLQELSDSYTGSASKKGGSSPERVAVGMELLGLRQSLEDLGIATETVDKVIEGYVQTYQPSIQNVQKCIQSAQQQGLTMERVSIGVSELCLELSKTMDRSDLMSVLPVNFDTRYFGYYFPLEPDELGEYFQQSGLT